MGKTRQVTARGFKGIYKSIFSKQFALYFFFSIFSSIADVLFFVVFLYILDFHYLISTATGFICGAIVGFVLNKYLNFKNKYKYIHYQFSLYLLISLSGFVLVMIEMQVFVVVLGLGAFISRILAAPLLTVHNYLGHRYLTFKVLR